MFPDAFSDLTKAIELGKEKQQRTTCQALCQRGLLYRKEGKIELAREDFNEAAKLGSHFAKNQVIVTDNNELRVNLIVILRKMQNISMQSSLFYCFFCASCTSVIHKTFQQAIKNLSFL